MPDLLAHALLAYSLGTILSWRYGWLDRRYVTVVMVGAFVPDLTKAMHLVPSWSVEAATGLPFGWRVFETGGGTVLAVLVGVVLAATGQRGRVAVLLGVGAASHLLTGAMLLTPSGYTKQLLWPVVGHRVPSPGLYLSTDPGPTVACGVLALAVWLVGRRRRRSAGADEATAD